MKFPVAARCGAMLWVVAVGPSLVAPIFFAQNSLELPAEQKPILTVKGDGVQIYACKDAGSGAGAQWALVAPDAKLLDTSGKVVGTHGAGPFWKSADGSLVKGQVVAKNNAPGAGDVPWLLLKASAHEGEGVMSKVEYIRRTETHGGAAPATGCDAQHLNVELRAPYTATYAFYAAK